MTNIELIPMEVIMAMVDQKDEIDAIQSQSALSSELIRSICLRCGGLMVNEVSLDLLNSSSELECATKRCVQCGDILDAVILQNRYRRPESMTVPNH
jgi:RNase P subunit RPR2